MKRTKAINKKQILYLFIFRSRLPIKTRIRKIPIKDIGNIVPNCI